jgi:hypothetical protein
MSKRIPYDIQFLLESILTEDPDSMTVDEEDSEKLNKKGADVPDMDIHWEDSDAVPFYIDEKEKVIVFSERNTHGRIERSLLAASNGSRDRIRFDNQFSEENFEKCVGIQSVILMPSKALYFYGLKDNTREGIRQYLVRNEKKFRYLSIRGGSASDTELSGRLWRDFNAISFWNHKKDIIPYMRLLVGFMSAIGLNPQRCVYEFIDSRRLYAFKDLGKAIEADEKLSAADIQDKLAKKHLEKNKADYDPEFWERHGKKAAKGFEYPAKADASVPALEGHIKLKDLLKENPDFVSDEHGGKIAKYFDTDAIAFFAFKEFSILNRGGVHYDMLNTMRDIYDDGSPAHDIEYLMDEKGFLLSSSLGLIDELDDGPLGQYFKNYSADYSDETGSGSDGSSPNAGAFRTKSGGLAGRIWTKKKIISFWNRKEDVVKRWNEIQKMFKEFEGMLGDLGEYRVDWLERDASVKTPMTPASEVSSAGSSGDKQQTFLDALFGEKKLSDEDIKKLQGRLHTMSAQEKKKVMLNMGYKNVKAADIADKLGMTVAEFNHIMHVNEETVE